MEKWTYKEFLQDRLQIMEAEMRHREIGSPDHNYWKGRAVSYRDALAAIEGTTLIRAPQDGGNIKVEAA